MICCLGKLTFLVTKIGLSLHILDKGQCKMADNDNNFLGKLITITLFLFVEIFIFFGFLIPTIGEISGEVKGILVLAFVIIAVSAP